MSNELVLVPKERIVSLANKVDLSSGSANDVFNKLEKFSLEAEMCTITFDSNIDNIVSTNNPNLTLVVTSDLSGIET
uniref:hypothetical protein n=1 Tax=Phascolarctobacterium sp. TaxID=2049039 RepID=UPI00386D0B45